MALADRPRLTPWRCRSHPGVSRRAGTQEIYGGGYLYNYTADPMLVEQRDQVARLGANQMKVI